MNVSPTPPLAPRQHRYSAPSALIMVLVIALTLAFLVLVFVIGAPASGG